MIFKKITQYTLSIQLFKELSEQKYLFNTKCLKNNNSSQWGTKKGTKDTKKKEREEKYDIEKNSLIN